MKTMEVGLHSPVVGDMLGRREAHMVGTHHSCWHGWNVRKSNEQELASAVTLPQDGCVQSVRANSSGSGAERTEME